MGNEITAKKADSAITPTTQQTGETNVNVTNENGGIVNFNNYITYAAELQRIKLQLNDLLQAESDIVTERMSLNERLQTLFAEKDDVDALVNHELKPKVAELKTSLQNYRRAIEIQNESNLITGYETTVKSELFEKMTEEDSEIEFKISEIDEWVRSGEAADRTSKESE